MPQTCPHCGSEAADDARACPSCGASLSAGSRGTQDAPSVSAPAPAAPAAAAPSASAMPAYKFDAARLTLADRITGVATVVLFISLFLSWFGISVIGITVTVSGVSAHGYLYIVMILSILIIAYLMLRAGWEELPGGMNVPHLTTMLTWRHWSTWSSCSSPSSSNRVVRQRRLGVRCFPRTDRGNRCGGALRDSAAARQDHGLIATASRAALMRSERPSVPQSGDAARGILAVHRRESGRIQGVSAHPRHTPTFPELSTSSFRVLGTYPPWFGRNSAQTRA